MLTVTYSCSCTMLASEKNTLGITSHPYKFQIVLTEVFDWISSSLI